MIIFFKCKVTQNLFQTEEYAAKFALIKNVAKRKLLMLREVTSLEYLRQFPKNCLEKLKQDRLGQLVFASMTSIEFALFDIMAMLMMSKL